MFHNTSESIAYSVYNTYTCLLFFQYLEHHFILNIIMKFTYLYDVEQFGQKCNLPGCNNVTTGEIYDRMSKHA